MTFNPASGTAHEEADAIGPDAVCENCGGRIWEHRDGGLAYGLICPEKPLLPSKKVGSVRDGGASR